jgi:hypothetical protein
LRRAVITGAVRIFVVVALLCPGGSLLAQELEPRRWGHLPTGSNFAGIGYAYTDGELFFDPVLKIDDAEVELHSTVFKYIRTFGVGGKSARVDLIAAYQDGTWEGLLDGAPARAERSGWADPIVRVAVNLLGAPALEGKEFAAYRESIERETIVGLALAVHLPFGEYFDDKLINLGSNRFTFRPQLGVVHARGRWSFELTGSAWFFTDNDDFFGDTRREQDPIPTLQGHVVYTFRPGLWVTAGVGYGYGGESTIDGDRKRDETNNVIFGAALGVPINRHLGVKIGYLGSRTQNDTGLDSDSVTVAMSILW